MQTILNAAITAGTSTTVTNATTAAREPSNVPGLNSILESLPLDATEAQIKAAIAKRIDAMRAHAEIHGYNVIRFSTPGVAFDVDGAEVRE
jgi:hypothetical protein